MYDGAVRERNLNESMDALYEAIASREVSYGEHMNALNAFEKVRRFLMENSEDFKRITLRGYYDGEQ